MVERLRDAIEKARQQRERGGPGPAEPARTGGGSAGGGAAADRWLGLPLAAVDTARLQRERIVTYGAPSAATAPFDALRTRLLKVCRDNGWRSIGIVSPTKGCGKSMVSCNLAFSIARQKDARLALLDVDMRAPRVASLLGIHGPWRIGDFFRGQMEPAEALVRVDENLAVGLNTTRERQSAELLQSAVAGRSFAQLHKELSPDLVLVDLPPLLMVDDAIAFLPHIDAVLLVIAAGRSTAKTVEECERIISNGAHFLGVMLNKYEGAASEPYLYGYGEAGAVT